MPQAEREGSIERALAASSNCQGSRVIVCPRGTLDPARHIRDRSGQAALPCSARGRRGRRRHRGTALRDHGSRRRRGGAGNLADRGNLLPRIRSLYRAEKIDAVTVRHLTLVSKAQQREWLALADDPEARAPVRHQLKTWPFGGASISTNVALFDLARFEGDVVADLFGEDGYFANVEQFGAAQNAAVEERRCLPRGRMERGRHPRARRAVPDMGA